MALLLECAEIKKLWPAHNRALKKFDPKFGLFVYEDLAGYKRISVGKLSKYQTCFAVVNRENDAVKMLTGIVDKYRIDPRLCRFSTAKISRQEMLMNVDTKALPPVDEHNSLVEDALHDLDNSRPTFAILDKGRERTEKSCIWIEKGNFYGMGYIDQDCQYQELSDIRESLNRYVGNYYMNQLVINYAQKYPNKVLQHV